ncbi:MAG: UbiA family prenyltransferase [Lachnospiraceae bacterium]|nr:UbiA family prenyltransferase [Lachnospiraceae bacterium]
MKPISRRDLSALTRAGEWADSKLSYFLVSVGLLVFSARASFEPADILFLLANGVFFASFLGCSYMINDIADREVDLRAGKEKPVTKYSPRVLAALFSVIMALGIACIAAAELVLGVFAVWHLAVILAVYYLGFSYSVKPLRFKEKGLFGAVFCSCAQRIFPLAVTCLCFSPDRVLLAVVVLQNFFVGMRYILVHQLIDRTNDIRTGVRTFSTDHPDHSRAFVYANVIAEIALIIIQCVYVIRHFPSFAGYSLSVIAAAYMLLLVLYVRAVRYMLKEHVFETFSFVPFEDYYNILLPLWFYACMLTRSAFFLVFLFLLVFMQRKMIKVRGEFLLLYIRKVSGLRKTT